MNVNTEHIVSISDADQDFSKAAETVGVGGEAVIFKNDKPKFRGVDMERERYVEMSDDEKIDFAAARILEKDLAAFEELAK